MITVGSILMVGGAMLFGLIDPPGGARIGGALILIGLVAFGAGLLA